MEAARSRRLICGGAALLTVAGFYALIRLLPSLDRASDSGVVVRELGLIAASLGWLVLLARRSPLSAQAMGLTRLRLGDVGWGFAVALATIVLSVAIAVTAHRMGVGVHSETALGTLPQRPPWLLALVVLTAAISEEAVFRSALIPALEGASGSAAAAVLVSTLIFSLFHIPGYGVEKVLVVAAPDLLMGGLFVWRRSLPACLIAHALVDGVGLAPLLFRHG